MDKTCETCRFGVNMNAAGRGEGYVVCRRYPPIPLPNRVGEIVGDAAVGIWPMTDAEDRCGEHQPKDSADDK